MESAFYLAAMSVHCNGLVGGASDVSEADAAMHALSSAVHRLRKLIGEHALERQDGQLTLNEQHCWLDVWALEITAATHMHGESH